MNRRTFFSRLAALFGGAAVAPLVPFVPEPIPKIEAGWSGYMAVAKDGAKDKSLDYWLPGDGSYTYVECKSVLWDNVTIYNGNGDGPTVVVAAGT